ncbi:uncharacterized protein Aud_005577 [Aspergillus udagawae]|uniref:Uncharacterized protein n=1 Tax=Aspergillus udagawae TaxID=91492 RepID=A0A8E0V217_9EURO|nr:uncharacterized protein Aud_005577 [Aspergillus udagawae]GIC89174.1 hypothetical protein Aud_005577 [Aspergillus udagawae]
MVRRSQGVIRASAAGAVEVSRESSLLSSAPPRAPQSPKSNSPRGSPPDPQSPFLPPQAPPEQPTTQKRKQRQPAENTALRRSTRPRKNVQYKV